MQHIYVDIQHNYVDMLHVKITIMVHVDTKKSIIDILK